MIDALTRKALREAFAAGQLRVQAVDPQTQEVGLFPIQDVLRHHTPHKRIVQTSLADGRDVTTTEDHSLFTWGGGTIHPTEALGLKPGDVLVIVGLNGQVSEGVVNQVHERAPLEFTYDLSVPGPQNFVLANGILAHNSYSIGGVSLDLERSSKYESLKSNAEGQFDKATEAKARTVKFCRGLQQPRYGIGIRSAFGPNVGRGILSPRNFL